MASAITLDDYRVLEAAQVRLIRAARALADEAERVLTLESIVELRSDVAAITAALDVMAPLVPD